MNSNLVSAAPDLLAACKSAVETLYRANQAVRELQENHRSVGLGCDCWGCRTARSLTQDTDQLEAAIAKAEAK